MVMYDTQGNHGDFLVLDDIFDTNRVYLARKYRSPNGVQYTATPLSKDQLRTDIIDRYRLSLELTRTNRELAEIPRIIGMIEDKKLGFTLDTISFLRGLQCSLQDQRRNIVEDAETLDSRIGEKIRDSFTNR